MGEDAGAGRTHQKVTIGEARSKGGHRRRAGHGRQRLGGPAAHGRAAVGQLGYGLAGVAELVKEFHQPRTLTAAQVRQRLKRGMEQGGALVRPGHRRHPRAADQEFREQPLGGRAEPSLLAPTADGSPPDHDDERGEQDDGQRKPGHCVG